MQFFFLYSMVLTCVHSVIRTPLALVGRTAVKLAFLIMYFHSWSVQTNAGCLHFFYWIISCCILHAKWLISFVATLHSADVFSLMPASSMFFAYWIFEWQLRIPSRLEKCVQLEKYVSCKKKIIQKGSWAAGFWLFILLSAQTVADRFH